MWTIQIKIYIEIKFEKGLKFIFVAHDNSIYQ